PSRSATTAFTRRAFSAIQGACAASTPLSPSSTLASVTHPTNAAATDERDAGDRGERVEVVFPALALADVVRDAVGEAERDDRVPRGETAARERRAKREDRSSRDRDPHVPAVERPPLGPPEPRGD